MNFKQMLSYDSAPINEFWTKNPISGNRASITSGVQTLDKHKNLFWFISVNDAINIIHYWTFHWNYRFKVNRLVFWMDSYHLVIAEPDYISDNFYTVRWFLSKALAKPTRSAFQNLHYLLMNFCFLGIREKF